MKSSFVHCLSTAVIKCKRLQSSFAMPAKPEKREELAGANRLRAMDDETDSSSSAAVDIECCSMDMEQ